MAEQRTSQELVPGWQIRLNGGALPEEVVRDVLSVEVEQHVNGSDALDIELSVWDVERQDFKHLDDGTFAEGSVVEVLIGYGEDLVALIEAEVVAIEVDFGAATAPVMRVRALDRLHRFRRGRSTRTFTNVKDSAVAEAIARRLQLQADVEDTHVVHSHLFQYNQSDIDFLQERARRIHFEVDIRNNTLHFHRSAEAGGRALSLMYRDDLKTLTLRLSTLAQVSKIVVKGWDTASKAAIIGLGAASDAVTQMGGRTLGTAIAADAFGEAEEVILDKVVFAQSEADQIAKAAFNKMSLGFIRAEGECIGNAALRAGEVIEIGSLGARFSGLYYIMSTHHIIDDEGYRTRLVGQRNAVS